MKNKTSNQPKTNGETLDSIINESLKNLKEIVDVNTVVGKQIKTKDGTIIIPISKIIVGYVAGGGEQRDINVRQKDSYPFSGVSGAGFTVTPIGFLTGKNNSFVFVSTNTDNKYDNLINLANRSFKLIIDGLQNDKKNKK